MCIWQLRNVFAVKNVHAIVYLIVLLYHSLKIAFCCLLGDFFLKLRILHWVTLVILGLRGELPVSKIVCKVCRFLICWYSQVLVDTIYCAKLIMYESQASRLLPKQIYFFLISWGIIWLWSFHSLSSKDQKLAQTRERTYERMCWCT